MKGVKNCKWCGKQFERKSRSESWPYWSTKTYCCRRCFYDYRLSKMTDEERKARRLQVCAKYRLANKHKERGYYLANREKILKRSSDWARSHPEEYQNRQSKCHGLLQAKKYSTVIRDLPKVEAIYDRCTELRKWFDVQVDHIIPFSKGGTHEPSNLQIIYAFDNRRKNALLGYKPRVIFK